MTESRKPEDQIAEMQAAAKTFAEIAQTSQQLMSDFLQRQSANINIDVTAEGSNFGNALMELGRRMARAARG